MRRQITLTDQENKLRQLLLDTANYVGTLEGCKRPELRFTGGWVRDKILGHTSHDIDIGIDNMTGHRFGTLMKQYLEQGDAQTKYGQGILGGQAKIDANPEKSKHLETITTKILGFEIDLVNLRKETYTEDSRNPTMEFGTPEEDAFRRDATVNALFYNLSSGEVEDFTGRGFHDMERQLIKTPLPPLQTFKDDPLRILRAIRFASRLGYEIATDDKEAMCNSIVKTALKAKISRERVGAEITKMLKGPNPHKALSSIDVLDLYNTIFTYPQGGTYESIETSRWVSAYDLLLAITTVGASQKAPSSSLQTIKVLLIRNTNDLFLAWVLVCFVPWARKQPKLPGNQPTKRASFPASVAAREGIKADNRICKILDDAVKDIDEIVTFKEAAVKREMSTVASSKRKSSSVGRDVQGQAIRTWGSQWRSSVIFALLTEVYEATSPEDRTSLTDQYAIWLNNIGSLDLLDVDRLKPLVNGNQISRAIGGGHVGPWMKKAMDIAMEWQLRNPDISDPAGGIDEVLRRKKELGFD